MKRGRHSFLIFILVFAVSLFTTVSYSAFVKTQQSNLVSSTIQSAEKVCYYNDGSKTRYFTTVEKALECANADYIATKQTMNVYVIPGDSTTVVNITRPCTIGSGVTLTLPYEGETWANESTSFVQDGDNYTFPDYHPSTFADNDPVTYRKLQLVVHKCTENGKVVPTITIEEGGKLNVGGYRGSPRVQGGTAGKYAEMVLENDAIIDCNGVIEVNGFVKESVDNNGSVINVDRGEIIQPLCIYDWGSAGKALAMIGLTIIVTIVDGIDAFPFNIFDLPQVSPTLNISYTGKMKATVWIFGNSAGDMKTEAYLLSNDTADNPMIVASDSNSSVIWKNTDKTTVNSNAKSNVLTKKDTTNHVLSLDLDGHYTLGVIKMSIDYTFTIEIDSSKWDLPLSYIFNINLLEGAVFDINHDVKMLPGSNLTIGHGAIVNIASGANCTVYSTNKSGDKTISYYSKNTPANFINNGTLNILGGFGGQIQTNTNGKGQAQIAVSSSATLITTITEPYGFHSKTVVGYDLPFQEADSIDFEFKATADVSDYIGSTNHTVRDLKASRNYGHVTSGNSAYWNMTNPEITYQIVDEGNNTVGAITASKGERITLNQIGDKSYTMDFIQEEGVGSYYLRKTYKVTGWKFLDSSTIYSNDNPYIVPDSIVDGSTVKIQLVKAYQEGEDAKYITFKNNAEHGSFKSYTNTAFTLNGTSYYPQGTGVTIEVDYHTGFNSKYSVQIVNDIVQDNKWGPYEGNNGFSMSSKSYNINEGEIMYNVTLSDA